MNKRIDDMENRPSKGTVFFLSDSFAVVCGPFQ